MGGGGGRKGAAGWFPARATAVPTVMPNLTQNIFLASPLLILPLLPLFASHDVPRFHQSVFHFILTSPRFSYSQIPHPLFVGTLCFGAKFPNGLSPSFSLSYVLMALTSLTSKLFPVQRKFFISVACFLHLSLHTFHGSSH